MPVIVGTGGHVDHGKTLLVTRLTGHDEDLDRWEEEKKRGLTIDLGFAFMEDGHGGKVSFVDVPGHEDFVNNMVVGATGIDIGLLVVAADDSVMPQTVEHLDIMDLLGITDYIAAVSKTDTAEEEMIPVVEEDVRDLFRAHPGCTLHSIVRTSASEKTGIDELKENILTLCASVGRKRDDRGFLRLPVDRVFTVSGFGTVVTGSLISGTIRTGEDVEIMPSGVRARVRGIEVDDESVEEAVRGQRTALNLSGIERAGVGRGDQVVFPGSLDPAYMVNAVVSPAVSLKEPVANRREVRFMCGTGSRVARIEMLDRREIRPGDRQCLVQLRFKEAAPVKNLDRFILRELSPEVTIGGGTVLETADTKLTGAKTGDIDRLKKLMYVSPDQRIEEYIRKRTHEFTTVEQAAFEENRPAEEVGEVMERLSGPSLRRIGEKYIHNDTASLYADAIRSALSRFHNDNPYDPGTDEAGIMNRLPRYFNPDITDTVLDKIVEAGDVIHQDGLYRVKGFSVSLSDEEASCAEKILETMLSSENRYTPPSKEEIASMRVPDNVFENAFRYLMASGKLVQVAKGILFPRETVDEVKKTVEGHIRKEGNIEASQLRDALGNSRKYAIALLEYFDDTGFTHRIGDSRVLKNPE